MTLWSYARRGSVERGWKQWISWALRSGLELVRKVARMVKEYLTGIVNAVVCRATNDASESINAKIQKFKARACGFRNREHFRNAILFHLGGLGLYPAAVRSTHTTS